MYGSGLMEGNLGDTWRGIGLKEINFDYSGSSGKDPYMGQFLQGGKNGRLMSFFF